MRARRVAVASQFAVALLVVVVAGAYAVVDRVGYRGVSHRRTALHAEAASAWHDLFVAQAQAERRASVRGSAREDSLALTSDPVLAAHGVLQETALRMHVHVASVTPGVATPAGNMLRTPVSVAVDGRYPDIVRLLADLETSPLLFFVTGSTLGAAEGPGGRVTGALSLLVVTVPPGGTHG